MSPVVSWFKDFKVIKDFKDLKLIRQIPENKKKSTIKTNHKIVALLLTTFVNLSVQNDDLSAPYDELCTCINALSLWERSGEGHLYIYKNR